MGQASAQVLAAGVLEARAAGWETMGRVIKAYSSDGRYLGYWVCYVTAIPGVHDGKWRWEDA